LSVVCAEASLNGLRVAQQRKLAQGAVFGSTNADARRLPFRDSAFDGAYCFGLLHEFTSETWEKDVDHVMHEVNRVLCDQGILAITVLSGDPDKTMPNVRFFTRAMFDHAIRCFHLIEVEEYDDIGCTDRPDYHVWYGLLQKRTVPV
jgi:ubiquinone/menaquinone biosynthesis C-methylase UbiE